MKTLIAPLVIAAALLAACADTKKSDELVDRGKALIAEGKHEAAVAELTKATEADKNSMQAWLQLGYAYQGMKRHDDALAAFVAAKKLDRLNVEPYLAHALLQAELGRIELAIQELTLVTEMDPKNLKALRTLGRISQLPHKQPDGTVGVSTLDLQRAELNLEAAATLAPNDNEIRDELTKVRAALEKK